jgi:predicted SprT family Zn-dependent metalloprotease
LLAPDWAVKMVKEVCAVNDLEMPGLTFRQSRKIPLSTGSMWPKSKRIVVTFGTAGHDHQQVLLHELAHYLNTKGGHGKEFYIILKNLLVKYDCLTDEYKERQYKYHKISMQYL